MNTNTLVLAIALTFIANSALANRNAGSRTGKVETRVMTEADREALRNEQRRQNPNAVDAVTGRQQNNNRVEADRMIREAFNGTLATKSLTDVNALIALDAMLPLSNVAKIISDAVRAENTMLNRQQSKGTDSPIARVATKNVQLLDALAKQASSNPKYRTEAGRKEVQELLEIIEVELMNTSGWSITRVRNLETYLDVLNGGISRGLLPSEATALQARFTWEELKERCKRASRRV